MRNTDRIQKSLNSELTDLREFVDQEGNPITFFTAWEIMRTTGNYVMAKDGNGTWHRVSLQGQTEYKEACPEEEAGEINSSERV